MMRSWPRLRKRRGNNMADTWTHCKVGAQFGPHRGKQMRSPKYFTCGCDEGKCEAHGLSFPLGARYEPGEPRKCKKHSSKGAA
jgi:hypothetical protein